ncbi:hypothetical protein WMY93_003027 [Mugilogobius chulae]|uniref:Cerebellar degeneration-related protein 2-like n=1 Tax=Mugilogobius chulae TaxID=88201 RepID=A0AAW0PVD5_9GOBI
MLRAPGTMEEFETEEDEPWYDQRDLEQDLHLAAELGKTLLERNKELEDSLQQMYVNNEEQVQEIEYLSKQLEMLRDMNEQHAKVYEQLDVTARELEITNEKLVLESKASQQKIDRLTSTMDTLHAQVESLTARVEELRTLEELRVHREKKERRKTLHSFPASKNCALPHGMKTASCWRTPAAWTWQTNDLWTRKMTASGTSSHPCAPPWQPSAPNARSREGVRHRPAGVRTTGAAPYGSRGLPPPSTRAGGGATRDARTQEVPPVPDWRRRRSGELTQQHPRDRQRRRGGVLEEGGDGASGEQGQQGVPVRKSCSDTALNAISARDASGRRQGSYAMHANGVRKRGMSILREVDEQYHALLEKYEELLGKCRRHEESLCHAEVQTSRPVSRDPSIKDYNMAAAVGASGSVVTAGPSSSSSWAGPPTPPQTPSTPRLWRHQQAGGAGGQALESEHARVQGAVQRDLLQAAKD